MYWPGLLKKSYKASADSDSPDQPAHLHSLIRAFIIQQTIQMKCQALFSLRKKKNEKKIGMLSVTILQGVLRIKCSDMVELPYSSLQA